MRNLLYALVLALVFVLPISKAQAQNETDQITISLLTCTPGQELYSLFGHSAIRVQDPSKKMDVVFNFGTFNFNTPNFYLKFCRGKLKYMLSVNYYKDFKASYKREQRGIVEQELKLSQESKQKLLKALWENYRPENRYYTYDFLFNNCSTLIRDAMEQKIEGQVEFEKFGEPTQKTFWNLLDVYLKPSPWIYTGIHLILGMPCDIVATPYQYQFLPDNMLAAFDHALITQNGEKDKFVTKKQELIEETAVYKPTPWYIHPLFVFALITFIGLLLTLRSLKTKKRLVLLDVIVFGSSSLLGWLILFMWFLTDHQATGPNLNILWALPIHLPLLYSLLKKNRSSWVKPYFKYHSIFILLVIAFWALIPQDLPYTILPFVVLILIRSIYHATRS